MCWRYYGFSVANTPVKANRNSTCDKKKVIEYVFNKALPQNQWVGFGVKSGFMRQITVVSSALIGVETRERFQRALSVCRWQRQSRRSGSAKRAYRKGLKILGELPLLVRPKRSARIILKCADPYPLFLRKSF